MKIQAFGLELGLKMPWEKKASETAPIIYLGYGQQVRGVYHPRNPAQYADDAYRRNVVAYRAISVIARSAAFIPLEVMIGDKEADPKHPLAMLLKRPNPWQGGAAFIESVIGYYLLAGNTFMEGVGPEGQAPRELWSLRADRTRVLPGKYGPEGYTYEVNGQYKNWKADPLDGKSPIMHMKTWNPLSDWYGMSPVEAAAWSIDAHNMAGEWNQGLLQNSARPSGALVYSNENGGTMTDKQFERLKEQINSAYSGTRNAGRPIILEGDLDWKQMSLSPAEMDWINGKNINSREIAQVFGCPPQILGIPGDNTYSNYQEARMALYEDTVIPILDQLCDHLNVWLAPAFGEDITIKADMENLPALAPKREKRWTMVQNATWLTTNEKREATGYEALDAPEADEVLIASGMVPLTMEADTDEPKLGPDGKPIIEDDENPEADLEGDEEQETGKPPKGTPPAKGGKPNFMPKKEKKFFGFLEKL
jgi:HK97 family phage portal protein